MGLLNKANTEASEQKADGALNVAHLKLIKKPNSGSDSASSEAGKRILIVEDESSVRSLLEHMFILEGYQTTVAEDGKKGVASFEAMRQDLVFTDLHLPGMSGTEVAKSIKAISPSTPVIAITGWGTSPSGVDNSEQLFDFIISKPFELDALLEMAANLTASR